MNPRKIPTVQCPRPSDTIVRGYLSEWKHLEKYRLQEASLGLLFRDLCPRNEQIEHVLLKVCALNDFYSTNIFDTYSVAKHILDKNVDSRLSSGDLSLVNDIALVSIKSKTKNFYSFASKYCSHHLPNDFPIFDSFVEKVLLNHQRSDRFTEFKKPELRDYKRFIEIIRNFKTFYHLERFTLREIDIYLWLAGKEYFPKSY